MTIRAQATLHGRKIGLTPLAASQSPPTRTQRQRSRAARSRFRSMCIQPKARRQRPTRSIRIWGAVKRGRLSRNTATRRTIRATDRATNQRTCEDAMNLFLHLMKHAAHDRHRALVQFWYAPGPLREVAYGRHEEIVKAVYQLF